MNIISSKHEINLTDADGRLFSNYPKNKVLENIHYPMNYLAQSVITYKALMLAKLNKYTNMVVYAQIKANAVRFLSIIYVFVCNRNNKSLILDVYNIDISSFMHCLIVAIN